MTKRAKEVKRNWEALGDCEVREYPIPQARAEARHELRMDNKCLSIDYKEGTKEYYLLILLPYHGLSPRKLAEAEKAKATTKVASK